MPPLLSGFLFLCWASGLWKVPMVFVRVMHIKVAFKKGPQLSNSLNKISGAREIVEDVPLYNCQNCFCVKIYLRPFILSSLFLRRQIEGLFPFRDRNIEQVLRASLR